LSTLSLLSTTPTLAVQGQAQAPPALIGFAFLDSNLGKLVVWGNYFPKFSASQLPFFFRVQKKNAQNVRPLQFISMPLYIALWHFFHFDTNNRIFLAEVAGYSTGAAMSVETS